LNGWIRTNRHTRYNPSPFDTTSAIICATAAPRAPRCGASRKAAPRSSANETEYTARSHTVRPTITRMNPTLPVATFTSWPIRRIRRGVLPVSKCAPNNWRAGPGATASSRTNGIVPATIHRVSAWYKPFSLSRSPRAWRSATNGLNM